MSTFGRVTVTLPLDLLQDIDRRENNRSKFVADAVRAELERLRREELQRSLANPHPESAAFADEGFDAWATGLPNEEGESLFDAKAAKPVRWVEGQGWLEGRE